MTKLPLPLLTGALSLQDSDTKKASLALNVASHNAPVWPVPHSPDLASICRKATKADIQSATWLGNSISPLARGVLLSQGGGVVLGNVLLYVGGS